LGKESGGGREPSAEKTTELWDQPYKWEELIPKTAPDGSEPNSNFCGKRGGS